MWQDTLSKEEPTHLTFEDRHGRQIGDNDPAFEANIDASVEEEYEIPGVPAVETTNIPGVHRRGPVELPGVDTADDMPNGNEGPTPVEFEPDELAEPADDELEEHPENNANLQPVAVEDAEAENVKAAAISENDPPAVENPPAVQLRR